MTTEKSASQQNKSLSGKCRGFGRAVGLGLLLASLTGCASLDTAAPPTAALAGPANTLASGRALYVGRCAKCHAVEPVHDYSPAQWATIIPDMAERTKLTPAETADLQTYVDAVLRARPGRGTSGSPGM